VTARAAQDACTALRFRRTWGWEFGVGGQVVRSGARVQVMLGSANHDPDQFDSPAPMKTSFSRKPRPRAIDRGAETSGHRPRGRNLAIAGLRAYPAMEDRRMEHHSG
jgi:hypothetical protein